MRSPRFVVGLVLALSLVAPVAIAKTRTKVVWENVKVRAGDDQAAREKALAPILKKEARRADWGDHHGDPVVASIEIRELSSVIDGDVVRVTCTAVGKLEHGRAAKSKFSFGGHPSDRAKLETHVLELVTRGIVARLAEMSRESAKAAEKK